MTGSFCVLDDVHGHSGIEAGEFLVHASAQALGQRRLQLLGQAIQFVRQRPARFSRGDYCVLVLQELGLQVLVTRRIEFRRLLSMTLIALFTGG